VVTRTHDEIAELTLQQDYGLLVKTVSILN